jgi:hypothetical protein
VLLAVEIAHLDGLPGRPETRGVVHGAVMEDVREGVGCAASGGAFVVWDMGVCEESGGSGRTIAGSDRG